MTKPAIVVNADDFGFSEGVTSAILRAFDDGLVSSTSLMANMPGFRDAARYARALPGRVGIHLNLTQGMPLTTEIRRCGRLCAPNGSFRARPAALHWLSRAERRAVEIELRAQVARCREAGIELSHIDSHHHVHTSWAAGGLVIALALASGIPFVRLSVNVPRMVSRKHVLYSHVFNRRLAQRRLNAVERFAALGALTPELALAGPSLEIMAHPRARAGGPVTDFDDGTPLAPAIEALLGGAPIVSFGDLARQDEPPRGERAG